MARRTAKELIATVLDRRTFSGWDDPIGLVGGTDEYRAELAAAREATGGDESVITGEGRVQGMLHEAGDVDLVAALYDKYDARVAWEVRGVPPSTPFSLEVFGYSSVLHFEVQQAVEDDGLWSVPLPRELVRYRHRRLRRAAAWGGCKVSFRHPVWPQVRVERELADIDQASMVAQRDGLLIELLQSKRRSASLP